MAARKRVEELEKNLTELEKEVERFKQQGKDAGIIVERIQVLLVKHPSLCTTLQ